MNKINFFFKIFWNYFFITLIKISFRNLFRHKGKTFVTGLILFIGGLIIILGGSTITAVDRNVKEVLVDRFLGDITIVSSKQKKTALMEQFFAKPIEVIASYDKVKEVIESSPLVENYLPYTIGFLMMLSGGSNAIGYPPGCGVFGVDFAKYHEMFGNFEILEGSLPKKGSRGLLITEFMRDMYFKFNQELYYPQNYPFKTNYLPKEIKNSLKSELPIKNDIVLMGTSDKNSVMDVRTPILGTFKYKFLRVFWREISLLDITSYRQCMNYNLGEDQSKQLSKKEQKTVGLEEEDIEKLFSSDSFLIDVKATTPQSIKTLFKQNNAIQEKVAIDTGAFQAIGLRLKNKKDLKRALLNFNQAFKQAGLQAKAIDWKEVGGAMISFLDGIRVALYVCVFFIFLVAIIIIMNTLAMSTLERSEELGMMRAIGAKKSFIGLMLLTETFSLSFLFGLLGMIVGSFLTTYLAFLKLPIKNDFLQVIAGGEVYQPVFLFSDMIIGIGFLALVTFLSILYPLFVSRKIAPLDAMVRD